MLVDVSSNSANFALPKALRSTRNTAPSSLRWFWWSPQTTALQWVVHTTPLSQPAQAVPMKEQQGWWESDDSMILIYHALSWFATFYSYHWFYIGFVLSKLVRNSLREAVLSEHRWTYHKIAPPLYDPPLRTNPEISTKRALIQGYFPITNKALFLSRAAMMTAWDPTHMHVGLLEITLNKGQIMNKYAKVLNRETDSANVKWNS